MSSHPGHAAEVVDPLQPAAGGWHCSHLFYSFDRTTLARMTPDCVSTGQEAVMAALDPLGPEAPTRLQVTITGGHKADFGLMMMDVDPLKIDAVHQRLMASELGPALRPGYSFVSMTEISEYVPSVAEYGERLLAEGEVRDSPSWQAKVRAYEGRLGAMNRQRLTPEFPPYRATCFYPMNKKRKTGENWFTLPKSTRNRLMSEHARSGMDFAGRVSQLITVAVGLDDWEWGVTLWASNPEYLKDIVYRMRFDEASARYGEFGPFITGYVSTPADMLKHCRIAAGG